MKLTEIEDERAFHDHMLALNARLQRERIPISARPYRAWAALQEDVQQNLLWFEGPESQRIAQWYVGQYGVRAGAGLWTHRRILALLGGDPWVLNVPMFYGTVRMDLARMIDRRQLLLPRGDNYSCRSPSPS
jgi:hypothetical protein